MAPLNSLQLNQVLRGDAAEPLDMAQFLWCLSVLGASHPPVQREVARTGTGGVNPRASFLLHSKDTHMCSIYRLHMVPCTPPQKIICIYK